VSKTALDRLSIGLAGEVGRSNIAVNCFKPEGVVVDKEGMRLWVKEKDRQGWLSPEKMVKWVVFLASQDARGGPGVEATD